jgi:uncharacterized protein
MRVAAGYVERMATRPSPRPQAAPQQVNPRVLGIVAELRRRLEGVYGERLEHVVLYGSQARGDADAESDIDVLVVLRGEVQFGAEIQRTSKLIGELALRNNVALSRTFVSSERYACEMSPFLMNVRREGLIL